ncbi:hypothetical protein QE152_g17117 [Popillia japonica]|uniref:Transmembrane protein n=1 Tax=Popillia japonica TaxID=7064 RepID=A0AAW1L582_POPJA
MKKSDLYCGRNLIYGITESSRWLPQQCCEPYTPPRHVNAAANSARLRSPERMGRHTTATSDLLHPLMLSYRANANHQPPFREFLHLTPRWLKATFFISRRAGLKLRTAANGRDVQRRTTASFLFLSPFFFFTFFFFTLVLTSFSFSPFSATALLADGFGVIVPD